VDESWRVYSESILNLCRKSDICRFYSSSGTCRPLYNKVYTVSSPRSPKVVRSSGVHHVHHAHQPGGFTTATAPGTTRGGGH
jgi:hypothetical protein